MEGFVPAISTIVGNGFHTLLYREVDRAGWLSQALGFHRYEYQLRFGAGATKVILGLAAAGVIGSYVHGKFSSKYPTRFDGLAAVPESLVPGNPLTEGQKTPSCQVQVALKKGQTLWIVGSGVRVEDYLVMPTHNAHVGYELWLVTPRAQIRVGTKEELSLAADASAYQVPASDWAQLGVGQAKFGKVGPRDQVKIVSSVDNKGSFAILERTDGMGRVHYHGSTIPGFSGAVYMKGAQAVGMHTHGGAQGGGYELLYLWARLKAVLRQMPEDSGEFFMSEMRSGFRFEDLEDGGGIISTMDGGYHLATDELYAQLKKMKRQKLEGTLDWQALEMEYIDRTREWPEFPESVPIGSAPTMRAGFSGEGQRPTVKGMVPRSADVAPFRQQASTSLTSNVQRGQGSQQDLTKIARELSEQQRRDFQKLSDKLSDQLRKTMGPQISQQKQNGGRSRRNSLPQPNGARQ